MCDGAEIFEAVTFFLEGVIRGGFAFDDDFVSVDLECLFCIGGEKDFADYGNGGANVEHIDLLEIIDFILFVNDLDIGEAGSVVKFDKADAFGVAGSSEPAANHYALVSIIFRRGKNEPQLRSFHGDHLIVN